MAWVKLDTGFYRNPKVIRAGRPGSEAYLRGLLWAGEQLTDGHIPAEVLPLIGVKEPVARRLVEVGLWTLDPHGDGWWIHDYPHHQRTREQVKAERAATAERQRRYKETRAQDPTNVRPIRPRATNE